MLTIDRVSRRFGGVYANQDVTLEVAEGELRGIIGPNGAGKSTLFNLIAGHIRPESGTISLAGRRIDRLPAHARARRGVGIVFQGARTFPGMSLLENVMVGAHARTRAGAVAAALRPPSQRREERRDPGAGRGVPRTRGAPRLGLAPGRRAPARPAAAAPGGPGARRACRGCCCSTSPPRGCAPRSGRTSPS